MRMTKVGVPVSSNKCLPTQLKMIALVSDVISIGRTDYNSRSGATPLSLHHSCQKVNPSVKSKIRKDKRKVKDVITGTRTQVSPPPSQKRYQQCEFPPRSKELRVNAAQEPSPTSLIIRLLPTTMFSVRWSQPLKHATLSTCGGKATHVPTTLPKIKEIGAACIFPTILLSGTSKRELFSEKTVCFLISTGNPSAQSISNVSPSNFHHGLSTCPGHIPPHTASVHLKFGCMRRSVRGLGTQ